MILSVMMRCWRDGNARVSFVLLCVLCCVVFMFCDLSTHPYMYNGVYIFRCVYTPSQVVGLSPKGSLCVCTYTYAVHYTYKYTYCYFCMVCGYVLASFFFTVAGVDRFSGNSAVLVMTLTTAVLSLVRRMCVCVRHIIRRARRPSSRQASTMTRSCL